MAPTIALAQLEVAGHLASAYVGGTGEPLLLIHGGWGGASLHWGSVMPRLAETFRVIAPDLPGIGRTDQAPLGSVGEYARWLHALIDALEVPSVWCVGNSFGASVACRFASDYPERCRGLVLVNGIPMPKAPAFLRWLGERPLGHELMRMVEKKVAYSASSLKRGFVDPKHVPQELRDLVSAESPPQLDALVDVLVQGGSSDQRRMAPLLVWGEDDHLLGTNARAARKLHASWPGSQLAFVHGAGHMPQVEKPEAFVDALVSFAGAPTAPWRSHVEVGA